MPSEMNSYDHCDTILIYKLSILAEVTLSIPTLSECVIPSSCQINGKIIHHTLLYTVFKSVFVLWYSERWTGYGGIKNPSVKFRHFLVQTDVPEQFCLGCLKWLSTSGQDISCGLYSCWREGALCRKILQHTAYPYAHSNCV